MATPIINTGFEHGVLSVNGAGIVNTIVGGMSVASDQAHSGTYSLKADVTTATAYVAWTLATPTVLVGRLYIRLNSLPGVANHIFVQGLGSAGGHARFRITTTGACSMGWSTGSFQTGPTLSAGVWYRLDFRADQGAGTKTIDWQVATGDGAGSAQTQATVVEAASTFSSLRIGPANTTDTIIMWFDDVFVGFTSGDYPVGAGSTVGLSPNADGTHNNAANVLEDSAGVDIGTTPAWSLLDDVPLDAGGATDRVQQTATGTGNYAEVAFTNMPSASSIIGVTAVLCYMSSGTAANQGATIVSHDSFSTFDAVYGDPTTRADMSEASAFFKRVVVTPPGGGWTESAVNALLMRIGYSGDVVDIPYWLSAIFEVQYVPAITGTGALSSSSSTGAGSGLSSSSGTGTPSAQSATVDGAGDSASVGSGTIAAQASTLAGSGTVSSADITGSGALSAPVSTLSGAGVSESSGSGAPNAQASTLSGAGLSEATGNGALNDQSSTLNGSGLSESFGAGALNAQSATLAGAGDATWAGAGALNAQASTLAGAGLSESIGSGAINAQASTIAGSGDSASVGSGALNSQSSTVAGSGLSISTSAGALNAQNSTVVGSGLSEAAGSGALNAQASTLAGSGLSESVGAGALNSQNSTVAGVGDVAGVISGSGVLAAQSSTMVGAGLSESIGSGALSAGVSMAAGVGLSESNGAGVLLSGVSTLAGVGISESEGAGVLVIQSASLSGNGLTISIGAGALIPGNATAAGAGLSSSVGSGALAAGAASIAGAGVNGISGSGALIPGSSGVSGAGTVSGAGITVTPGGFVQGRSYEEALEYWQRYGKPQGEPQFEWKYPIPAQVTIDAIELDDEEILLMI